MAERMPVIVSGPGTGPMAIPSTVPTYLTIIMGRDPEIFDAAYYSVSHGPLP